MNERVAPGPLVGCTVLVTRERPGELARLLAACGADVVHLPLIAVVDADDGGAELAVAVAGLAVGDWLLVTSAAGAERVGSLVEPGVRLGAVGTATARRLEQLAGRSVDVVPDRQLAAELADAVIDAAGPAPADMVVAQADRAGDELVDRLRSAGHRVTAVTAYRTVQLTPSSAELRAVTDSVDVLALASGSAARGWVEAFGAQRQDERPIVAVIGPSTAQVCHELGLRVDGVARTHTLQGLVDEIARLVATRSDDDGDVTKRPQTPG